MHQSRRRAYKVSTLGLRGSILFMMLTCRVPLRCTLGYEYFAPLGLGVVAFSLDGGRSGSKRRARRGRGVTNPATCRYSFLRGPDGEVLAQSAVG